MDIFKIIILDLLIDQSVVLILFVYMNSSTYRCCVEEITIKGLNNYE